MTYGRGGAAIVRKEDVANARCDLNFYLVAKKWETSIKPRGALKREPHAIYGRRTDERRISGVPPLPWWKVPSREWLAFLRRREEQVFLVLTLVIGALVGLIVVAFILLTEHVGPADLPCRGCTVAPVAGAHRGLAGDGLFAVQVFSGCARQRRTANEGRTLCARRLHFDRYRAGQILLHIGDSGERHSIGPRRAVGASRRGTGVAAGPQAGAESGKSEGADSGRRCGGGRSGVQHAAGSGLVCAGRSCRRSARTGAWIGGAGFGDFVGDAAIAAGQRSAVQGAAVSVGESVGVRRVRDSRRAWRARVGGVYQAAAEFAGAFPEVSAPHAVVSTALPEDCWSARWAGLCRRRWASATSMLATR